MAKANVGNKKLNGRMWKYFDITLDFNKRGMSVKVMGGIPKAKQIVASWIDASKMKDEKYKQKLEKGENLRSLEDIKKEVIQNTEAIEDKVHVGFLKDDVGIYAREHQIRAHMKDCGNQIRELLGISGLKAKIANKVFLETERFYFTKNGGTPVTEIDGVWEHGIRIWTPQGERSALKRNDYIENASLKFTVKVLNDKVITEDILKTVLDYGSDHGIFSERGMGYGKYSYTIEEVENAEVLQSETHQ